MDVSNGVLFVVDGSKALTGATPVVFGDKAVIQRCRIHYVEQRIMGSSEMSGVW